MGGFFMKKIISWEMITRETKIGVAASAIGLFLALAIASYTQVYAENIQSEISQNVIRFHVLANSNSAQDQALKNIVRDGILDRFGSHLNPSYNTLADIDDTRTFLLENLDDIQAYAMQLIQNEGFAYSVQGVLDWSFFPTRLYGDMTFPAGEYEALRIIIGEGRGGNWWCVMFPPLCYVDVATPNTVADRSVFASESYVLLQHLLSDEAYAIINHSQGDTSVTVRFKVVEWWQERMNQDSQDPSLYVRR